MRQKIQTNVTPTSKTRDFVDQYCFILTNEKFPFHEWDKVSK